MGSVVGTLAGTIAEPRYFKTSSAIGISRRTADCRASRIGLPAAAWRAPSAALSAVPARTATIAKTTAVSTRLPPSSDDRSTSGEVPRRAS